MCEGGSEFPGGLTCAEGLTFRQFAKRAGLSSMVAGFALSAIGLFKLLR